MNNERKKFWLDLDIALDKYMGEGEALNKFAESIKSSRLDLGYPHESIIYKYLTNKDDNYLKNLSILAKEMTFPLREIYYTKEPYDPSSLEIKLIKRALYSFLKSKGYNVKLKYYLKDKNSKKLVLLFDLENKKNEPILDRFFKGNKVKNKPGYFLITFTRRAIFFKEESPIIKKYIREQIINSLSKKLKIKFEASLGKQEASFKNLFKEVTTKLPIRQISLKNTDLPNARIDVISKKNIDMGINKAIERLKNNNIIFENILDVDSFLLNTSRIIKVKVERKIKDYYRAAIEFVLDFEKLNESEKEDLSKVLSPSKIYVNKDEKNINEDMRYLLKKGTQLDYYKKSLLETEIGILENKGIIKLDWSKYPPTASINEDNLYKEIFSLFKGSNPRGIKNLGGKKIEEISKLIRAFTVGVGGERITIVYGNPRKNSATKFRDFYLTNSKGKQPLFIVRDEDIFTKYELKDDFFITVPNLLAECIFKKKRAEFLKEKIIELKRMYRKSREASINDFISQLNLWVKEGKSQYALKFEKKLGQLVNYIFYSTFVVGGPNIPDYITCVRGEKGVLFWDSKFWTSDFMQDEEEKAKIKKYILAGLKEKSIKENGGLKAHILTGYIKDSLNLKNYFKDLKLSSFKDVQLKYVDFSFVKGIVEHIQSKDENNLINTNFYDKLIEFLLDIKKICFYEKECKDFLEGLTVTEKIDIGGIRKSIRLASSKTY